MGNCFVSSVEEEREWKQLNAHQYETLSNKRLYKYTGCISYPEVPLRCLPLRHLLWDQAPCWCKYIFMLLFNHFQAIQVILKLCYGSMKQHSKVHKARATLGWHQLGILRSESIWLFTTIDVVDESRHLPAPCHYECELSRGKSYLSKEIKLIYVTCNVNTA